MFEKNAIRPRFGFAMAALAGVATALAPVTLSASAGPVSNTTDYAITLAGLSLAKASFQTVIDNRKFTIQGHFVTTGLARLFRRVEGTANVSGRLKGDAFVAEDYRSDYVAGKAHKTFAINFAGGGVKSFEAVPGINPPPENWIAVTPENLARAVDPLSGLILSMPASGKLCDGTVTVFDGEALTSLQLAEKGDKLYRTGSQQIPAHVCALTIVPKAGYRKGRSDMEYAAKIRGMEIWFAKSPIADVYAPVKIVAPTGFGSLEISATRFGT